MAILRPAKALMSAFHPKQTLGSARIVGRAMGVSFNDQPPETRFASYEGCARFSVRWVVDGWAPLNPSIGDPNRL